MNNQINLKEELNKINKMNHLEMAYLKRFAPSGHIYFSSLYPELINEFKERFEAFGGMTSEISKQIGWNR